jgi:predicted Zn-dependent protease
MAGIRNPAVWSLLLLAACASGPGRRIGLEPDAEVREAVATTARAIAGHDVAVVVHVGHAVRAELRPDRSLHVWRGLLLRTRDADELAFALAHELAHDALAHPFPPRGAERDVEQEMAADARARETLAAAGFDALAGAGLMRALRDEAVAMDADATAVAELDRRLAAFPGASTSSGRRAGDAWHAVWLARRNDWLAADPASADPQRLAALERRAGAR